MSEYQLNKVLRDVNRLPDRRERYFKDPAAFLQDYDLTDAERDAIVRLDIATLYAMGAHGLILRPFTLLHRMSEPDYLAAIRSPQ